MSSLTILALLEHAAQTHPDKGLVFVQQRTETKTTYSQLWQAARENARILRDAGIVSPGKIVMIYFDSHCDNILWFWSIVAAQGVPSILNPLANDSKIREAQIANVECIFDEPIVLTSQHLAGTLKPTRKLKVVSTSAIHRASGFVLGGPQLETSDAVSRDLAVILFTSGSTGPSKAVEFSHAQLISSVANKAVFHGTHSDMTFSTWISLDHSVNLCEIHLNALYSCSDQVLLASTDLVTEPAQFFHVLSRYQIGYTFAPNAFLAAATKAFRAQDYRATFNFEKLSVIITGGEANRTTTIAAVDSLLVRLGASPSTIKSVYGLSETCSACFYNTGSPLYDLRQDYKFASVGQSLPGCLELRIQDEEGNNVTQNVPGAIQLRGDVVFKSYHNNDGATKSCMASDNWFDTGDVGFLDSNGALVLVGRSKEIIVINGLNYASIEVEYAIESSGCGGITPSYLATFSSWDDSSDSESIVVLFNPTQEASDTRSVQKTIDSINRAVIGFCGKQPLAIIPLPLEELPKSTIGKLSRRSLKERFEAGVFAQYRDHSEDKVVNGAAMLTEPNQIDGARNQSPMERKIAEIFSNYKNIPSEVLESPDALHHLGFDSIDYMRIKKCLEEEFRFDEEIPIAMLFRCSSIHELEQTLLSLGTVSREYDPIVPLSVHGSKLPIFLIHSGNGEFLSFLRLQPFLADRPVYALRAKGLHRGDGAFESLEALLDTYFAAIKKTQNHGPYAILGYCFGGLVAFELAKRLEAGGEEVAFVGGIDNPPDLASILVCIRHRLLMIDILPSLSALTVEEAQDFGAKTDHLSDDDFNVELFHVLSPELVESMDLTLPRLQGYVRVENSCREMSATYEPTGSASKWDCFRADPQAHFHVSDEEWRTVRLGAWSKFCRSEVQYYDIDGHHSNCMRQPHLDRLQQQINRALEARGI